MRKNYPEINILKGLGAVLVFLVHYSQSFSGAPLLLRQVCMLGQLGVQAFLLCTGFLLANSLHDREGFRYGNYLKKRLLNLAPLYWVTLILYALVQSVFRRLGIRTLFSATYDLWGILSNVFLVHGLIPAYNNTVVPGGWFVGTAILLYALLPPLLLRRGRRKISVLAAPVVALFSVLVCLALQYIAPELTGNNRFFFFSVLCQMPAVLEGIRLYESEHIAITSLPRCITKLGVLGLLCTGIFYIGNGVLVCLIPWLGSLLFVQVYDIVCFVCKKEWAQGLMQFFEKLGKNSYPVFLVHFMFAWFVPGAVKHVLGGRLSDTMLFFLLMLPCFVAAVWAGGKLGVWTQAVMKKLP